MPAGKSRIVKADLYGGTISEIKQIIEKKEKLQSRQYRLMFKDLELRDEMTFASVGMMNKSSLSLEPMQDCKVHLVFATSQVESIEMEISTWASTEKLKLALQDRMRISLAHHGLLYAGKCLHAGRFLESYNIRNHSALQLIEPIDITLRIKTPTNKYLLLNVKNTDSVKDVKSMFFAKNGNADLRLNFGSRWLKSRDILVDCKIHSGSSIWALESSRKFKTTL